MKIELINPDYTGFQYQWVFCLCKPFLCCLVFFWFCFIISSNILPVLGIKGIGKYWKHKAIIKFLTFHIPDIVLIKCMSKQDG